MQPDNDGSTFGAMRSSREPAGSTAGPTNGVNPDGEDFERDPEDETGSPAAEPGGDARS